VNTNCKGGIEVLNGLFYVEILTFAKGYGHSVCVCSRLMVTELNGCYVEVSMGPHVFCNHLSTLRVKILVHPLLLSPSLQISKPAHTSPAEINEFFIQVRSEREASTQHIINPAILSNSAEFPSSFPPPHHHTLPYIFLHSPNFCPPLVVANRTTPSCFPCHSCLCAANDSHSGAGIRGNIPNFKTYLSG
jgi:hypothetical protein